ncbi:cation:proton antiporter [candidate division KSB1 bacterium]|nr:cation:proton antiporter [candidate division KSB1 bacterium]
MNATITSLTTIIFAMFVGVSLSVIARHMRIPPMAPLLLGGVVLGSQFLGIIDTTVLGDGLKVIISLCVAIILFEGGLTLDIAGFKKSGGIITRLLTLGILITWFGTALAVFLIFNYSLSISLLAGSLVIVTGPTVISPLLQRIKVKENLHHILHWESVLIDPVGVFIAILCFEWLSIHGAFWHHFGQFSFRFLIGVCLGFFGGMVISQLLRRKWIPEEQANIFVLVAALLLFGLSEFFAHEAGIMTVVVAGLVLGWRRPERLGHIQQFKSELTELSIAILFILLSANLQMSHFIALGWSGVAVIAIVIFVIRPLNIAVSTLKSSLTLKERLFLSWVAPRGVVAASMASLFALQLSDTQPQTAVFLETFAFAVIAVTVLLQGFLSEYVAAWLDVKAPTQQGWLIVGAHALARKVAEFIQKSGKGRCFLVDTNYDDVLTAKREGLTVLHEDATDLDSFPEHLFPQIGNVLAITGNRTLNANVCEKWQQFVPKERLFRWSSRREPKAHKKRAGIVIWSDVRPDVASANLLDREAVIIKTRIERIQEKMIPGTVPLLSYQESHLMPHSFSWSGEGDALLFQPLTLHLPFFLLLENILSLQVNSYSTLIETVLEHARQTHPELPFEKTRALLLEQEHYFPTTLGHGVAIPHAHCADLKEPVCIIVRVPSGINMHAYDGEFSRLFFILLSPPADPETHLVLLADIARIASDVEKVRKLIELKSPHDVANFLMGIKSPQS